MFIEDFIDIDEGFSAVGRRLAADPSAWMARCADQAEEAGVDVVLRIGPSGALAPARRRVRVRVGQSRSRGDGMVIPIEWETIRLRGLFPRLEGDLELAPLGEGRCRLTLSGHYSPPLGVVGAVIDRGVLHKVAESTARSFLTELRGVLEQPAGQRAGDVSLPAEPAT